MKSIANNTKRGLLIVFEGVDRAGKSTQLEMLKNYLQKKRNEKCQDMRFPGKYF
jgi:dTMP kinase